MSSRQNRLEIPEAKAAMERFKLEAASEVGLSDYANIDKGNLTSRENGSVGGQMVKHMVEAYESGLTNK